MTDRDSRNLDAVPNDLSQRAHRRIIGALGLFLPLLLVLLAAVRSTKELPAWKLLDTVSAYYYTGAVGVFVGVLFALSLFLFTYQGYEGVLADRIVGSIGGAAALIVALFPTRAPDGLSAPAWWKEWMVVLHALAATVLFVAFILFSVWLFRKSNIPNRSDRPQAKRNRDDICLGCGVIMIVCVLWAGSSAVTDLAIFWPESIAIMAFAVSWLVKGEADQIVVDFAKRLARKSGSPQQG